MSNPAQLKFVFPAELEHREGLRIARLKKAKAERKAARPHMLRLRANKLRRAVATRKRRHEALLIKRTKQREATKKRKVMERAIRMYEARKIAESRIHSLALQAPNSQERTRILSLVPEWSVAPCIDPRALNFKQRKSSLAARAGHKSVAAPLSTTEPYAQFVGQEDSNV